MAEGQVDIRPYRTDWVLRFEAEAAALAAVCAPLVLSIEHVGSTAVPGLSAKPIIDVLIGLERWSDAEALGAKLEAAGYKRGAPPGPEAEQMFFAGGSGDSKTHVHVALLKGGHWSRLLAFRDALRGDAALAHAYQALKLALAGEVSPDAYSPAKSPFIQEVLGKIAANVDTDRFLKHQRAELARADVLRVLTLILQMAIAVIAAQSVFQNDANAQLTLAVEAGVLVVAWLILTRLVRRHRAAGDRARRIVLLTSGLGVCPADAGVLMESFSASTAKLPALSIDSYFDTRAGPGFRRLAEMLDESAFYTGYLQRRSGELMSFFLLATVFLAVGAWVTAAQEMNADTMVVTARVFLAFLVFLLSSDVLGAAIGHFEAARAMTEIRLRLNAAAARNHPQSDMTLIVTDYNSAVESAPMILPMLYKAEAAALSRQWKAYLAVETNRGTRTAR